MHSFLCKLYWARDISTKSQCISMLLYVRSLYSAFFFPLKVLFLNVLDENKSAYMFRKNLLSLWSTVHTANFASTTQTCGSYTLFPSPDFLYALGWVYRGGFITQVPLCMLLAFTEVGLSMVLLLVSTLLISTSLSQKHVHQWFTVCRWSWLIDVHFADSTTLMDRIHNYYSK